MEKRKFAFGVFVLCATLFFLACRQTGLRLKKQDIIIENKMCELRDFISPSGRTFPLTVSIDIPIVGEQCMIDSIAVFLNESLYAFFDNGMDCHIPYTEVYTEDLKRLVPAYRDAYAPFIPDDMELHAFNSDCLDVKMVAQTDTYVTYAVDRVFMGEGFETATEWVTFSKTDGHRLNEIISGKELLRFFEEHPEYRDATIWEEIQYERQEPGWTDKGVAIVGLLVDSLAHQFTLAPGIFEDARYPLSAIKPYLTPEAQTMVSLPR